LSWDHFLGTRTENLYWIRIYFEYLHQIIDFHVGQHPFSDGWGSKFFYPGWVKSFFCFTGQVRSAAATSGSQFFKFSLQVKKNLLRLGQKIHCSNPGWSLIHCRSEVCSGQGPSLHQLDGQSWNLVLWFVTKHKIEIEKENSHRQNKSLIFMPKNMDLLVCNFHRCSEWFWAN